MKGQPWAKKNNLKLIANKGNEDKSLKNFPTSIYQKYVTTFLALKDKEDKLERCEVIF